MGFQLVYYAYFLSYKTLRIFLAALSGFMYFRMNNLHKEDMNFKKIVAVDETLLNEAALKQLKIIGEEVVVYHDFPTEEEESYPPYWQCRLPAGIFPYAYPSACAGCLPEHPLYRHVLYAL